MDSIAKGVKNHEYRKYLLPSSVKRIWFYSSKPVSSIYYVAKVGPGKKPGEVPKGGIGNEDFNAGRKVSKYGYETKKLWRIHEPVSLVVAKSKGYLKGPPQKYCWAPTSLTDDYPLKNQESVIIRKERKLLGHEDNSVLKEIFS